MNPRPPPHQGEEYLLAIRELVKAKGFARVCEVAEVLQVKSASVSGMMARLHRKGWIVRRQRYALTLTEEGQRRADAVAAAVLPKAAEPVISRQPFRRSE